MIYQEKKQDDLFCKVYHDLVYYKIIKKDLNELSKNDKQIFIDLYNEYIKTGTPAEIKKLLDTYVLNLTDWGKIHEILKDKLPKTSIVYELMTPIYIQNNL